MRPGIDQRRAQLAVRTAAGLVIVVLVVVLVLQALRIGRADGATATGVTTTGLVPDMASTERGGTGDDEPGTPDEPTTPVEPIVPGPPVYTFVSAPDLLNADFGDLHGYPGWEAGDPNSFNRTSDDSLNRLFQEMASWQPDGVFVAGDEVRGHWDKDNAGTGTFGPVGTSAEKRAAIRRAGDFYFQDWKDRFGANGIDFDTVYPALGDHEIGDNPWPAGSFALNAVPLFKRVWADHFTTVEGEPRRFPEHPVGTRYDDTAYATYLTPELLLVTVDTFAWSDEELSVDVQGSQLEWLRGVLEAVPEGTEVIVQGHVPVLTPVRVRGSSGLILDRGAESDFWKLLEEHHVRLYLAGEVHNVTGSQLTEQGTVQVAHGGLFAHGTTGYLVGRVYANGTITLQARKMFDQATGADADAGLWQTRNPIQSRVRFEGPSESVGTMVISGDGTITSRTGELAPYVPEPGQAAVLEAPTGQEP